MQSTYLHIARSKSSEGFSTQAADVGAKFWTAEAGAGFDDLH